MKDTDWEDPMAHLRLHIPFPFRRRQAMTTAEVAAGLKEEGTGEVRNSDRIERELHAQDECLLEAGSEATSRITMK